MKIGTNSHQMQPFPPYSLLYVEWLMLVTEPTYSHNCWYIIILQARCPHPLPHSHVLSTWRCRTLLLRSLRFMPGEGPFIWRTITCIVSNLVYSLYIMSQPCSSQSTCLACFWREPAAVKKYLAQDTRTEVVTPWRLTVSLWNPNVLHLARELSDDECARKQEQALYT